MSARLLVGTASEQHWAEAPLVLETAERASLEALEALAERVSGADLAAPPVVLPDFHHKHRTESPSSITVATRDSIRPTLTSASVNCGMALIAFDGQRPDEDRVFQFMDRVRERYPFPPTRRRDLTANEVLHCALEGGPFAVERWSLEPEDLLRVERGGQVPIEPYGGAARARRELPWMLRQLSRMRFGTIGPSNHFVELQEVEEVLDPVVAGKLGVRAGQLTLQYHAGGGVLTGTLGALYGSRDKGSQLLKAIMSVQRPLHHLGTARSLDELRLRTALYLQGECPGVQRSGNEGERLMLANAMAMNYGFAFRLATYANLRQIALDVFGAGGRLVVDSPHNSIYEEDVDGAPAVVHRHNTSRAFPASLMGGHPIFAETGMPLLLPGTHRTSSYLCVAAEGASVSLHSSSHGTGGIVAHKLEHGQSGPDPLNRKTLRFRYKLPEAEAVTQLDNAGVDEGLEILTRNGIVRPVARLRPFAVLN